MSKSTTKSDKVFNAISRVVTFLLALGTFPLLIFSKLFYLEYTSTILGLFSGDKGATYFESSIYTLYTEKGLMEMIKNKTTSNTSEIFAPLMKPLIAILVLYGIVCLIALVIMGFSAFSNKKIPIICLSGGSIACLGGIAVAFHFLEKPLIDGTITLASLTDKWWGSLLSFLATVDGLKVGVGFWFIMLLYVGIILWIGAVMIAESGDNQGKIKAPKQPKEKKAKKVKEDKKAAE